MDMPTSAATGLTLKDPFDAGLYFGHQTKRWNPKMKPYIFDKRNGIHIIDLTQTVTLIDEAAEFLRKTILDGKKILFIATKKQAQEIVKQAAEDCGQYYMTERWLGGTLTNSQTIRGSVKRMRQIQALARANNGELSKHKQEASMLRRELAKLEKNLTGIADMESAARSTPCARHPAYTSRSWRSPTRTPTPTPSTTSFPATMIPCAASRCS